MQIGKNKTIGYCRCGKEITTKDLIGNVVVCPACGAIWFVQSDLGLYSSEEFFWVPFSQKEEAISYGINHNVNSGVKKSQIKEVKCELKYIPTVEVLINNKKERMPLVPLDDTLANIDWNSCELIFRNRKLRDDLRLDNDKTIQNIDSYILFSLKDKDIEISPNIKYAPIYMWSATVNNVRTSMAIDASRRLPIKTEDKSEKSLLGCLITLIFLAGFVSLMVYGWKEKSGFSYILFLIISLVATLVAARLIIWIAEFIKRHKE